MRPRLALLALPLLLAGCGLPTAVVVASYAADGISYIASGKSLTDHALSTVVQRDCALYRVVTEAALCRAAPVADDVGVALALAGAKPEQELLIGLGNDAVIAPSGGPQWPQVLHWGPPDTPQIAVASGPAEPAPAPQPAQAADGPMPFMVVGSFADRGNAERFARTHEGLNAAVVTAVVDGRDMHRVVTPASRDVVLAAGLDDAWPVRLCRDLSAAPCEAALSDSVNIAALPLTR